jgi:hypothetical protein
VTSEMPRGPVLVPVLLGDGIRLFDEPGGTDVALELVHVSCARGLTTLWYRVGRR